MSSSVQFRKRAFGGDIRMAMGDCGRDDAGESGSRFSGRSPVVLLPGTMVGATTALVAVGVALTVFAGPLFDLADNASENLINPDRYVNAVLAPVGPGGVSEEGR